ncbi:hypothetical protein Tco_1487114, partial [Tanacetum coccineum]
RGILPGYWLRFGVKNLADYNDGELPIPFRRQLVLLGVEGKRRIPDWMLRLANDRVGWDNYLWGSYVWPTLYSQLKNANVRRWPKLYATQPTTKIDKKSYSIFGYTWAFKGNMPDARLTPTGGFLVGHTLTAVLVKLNEYLVI